MPISSVLGPALILSHVFQTSAACRRLLEFPARFIIHTFPYSFSWIRSELLRPVTEQSCLYLRNLRSMDSGLPHPANLCMKAMGDDGKWGFVVYR